MYVNTKTRLMCDLMGPKLRLLFKCGVYTRLYGTLFRPTPPWPEACLKFRISCSCSVCLHVHIYLNTIAGCLCGLVLVSVTVLHSHCCHRLDVFVGLQEVG